MSDSALETALSKLAQMVGSAARTGTDSLIDDKRAAPAEKTRNFIHLLLESVCQTDGKSLSFDGQECAPLLDKHK